MSPISQRFLKKQGRGAGRRKESKKERRQEGWKWKQRMTSAFFKPGLATVIFPRETQRGLTQTEDSRAPVLPVLSASQTCFLRFRKPQAPFPLLLSSHEELGFLGVKGQGERRNSSTYRPLPGHQAQCRTSSLLLQLVQQTDKVGSVIVTLQMREPRGQATSWKAQGSKWQSWGFHPGPL